MNGSSMNQDKAKLMYRLAQLKKEGRLKKPKKPRPRYLSRGFPTAVGSMFGNGGTMGGAGL